MAKLPAELQGIIKPDDFNYIFRYLEKEYRVSVGWRVDYHSLPRDISTEKQVEYFVQFLTTNIEPALKHLLRRNDSIILGVLRYLFDDRIEKKTRANLKVSHRKK
jgi:hypothetical protein